MKKRTLLPFAMTVVFCGPAWAGEAAPKWWGHIDLEGKVGSDRSLGEADLFLPVLQDEDSLLFASVRTRLDDQSSQEGNFGLGMRHMLADGWNLGGYAYFDRRFTQYDNAYNQITVGAELLGRDWDFRANGYLPIGNKTRDVDDLTSAEMSATAVTVRGGEEHALRGFDAEMGYRIPLFDVDSGMALRAYAGGYVFDARAEGVPEVAGPRGRLEMTFDTLPFLWEGSRFALGGEVQHDDPRGTQSYVSARLRIPLQVFGGGEARQLTPQERRMTDPIIRDIDVVTQAGAYAAPEVATKTADGQSFTMLSSANVTTAAALNAALLVAGASTVVLNGTFSTNATIMVQPGQTVLGSGVMTVSTPSGRTASVALSGGAIATQSNATIYSVHMGDNSTLSGMAISNLGTGSAVYAVNGQGSSGVTIRGNVLTTASPGGTVSIDGRNSTNLTVIGNTINSDGMGAGAHGINVGNATGAIIADNVITLTTTSVRYAVIGTNATSFNTAASTGNVTNAGVSCLFTGGAPSGSVGFSAIPCP